MYVLNEATTYEISALLKYSDYAIMDSWNQSRLQCFVASKAAGSEIRSEKDFMKFPWDEHSEEPKAIIVPNSEIQSMQDYLNKNLH